MENLGIPKNNEYDYNIITKYRQTQSNKGIIVNRFL